jgi:hypothetical protein
MKIQTPEPELIEENKYLAYGYSHETGGKNEKKIIEPGVGNIF